MGASGSESTVGGGVGSRTKLRAIERVEVFEAELELSAAAASNRLHGEHAVQVEFAVPAISN